MKIIFKKCIYLPVMPKYWGEANFHTRKIPRSGSKAKEGQKEERLNDGDNNGQLCIATEPRMAHAKPPGQI